MRRNLELYWPFLGFLISVPFYWGYLKNPEISLQVISIFFGGLLAILLIIPIIESFEQIKKLKNTNHLGDLIYYIRFPLTLSILFIIFEFFSSSLVFSLNYIWTNILNSIYFGLWGIFFLSLIRLVIIIPHIIYNKDDTTNTK